MKRIVVAHAQHAREAHGDAGLVARACVDAFEGDLENQAGLATAHRAEFIQRGGSDDFVHGSEFNVGQAGVGFRAGQQLQPTAAQRRRRFPPANGLDDGLRFSGVGRRAASYGEGVVGVSAGAAAVAGLRADQHRVGSQRVDLPVS